MYGWLTGLQQLMSDAFPLLIGARGERQWDDSGRYVRVVGEKSVRKAS
ncbi:hypothetical protein GQ600_25418 [Phytophthora cactorum]|nr:hypothetical protein GQ600_25418 [Phytophthora cactorum]